jgi:uncharacterized Zn-finger protein
MISCQICDKKLSCRSSLTRHIKTVHDKIKNHLCLYEGCELKFTSKSNLARHVNRIHIDINQPNCIIASCIDLDPKFECLYTTEEKG